MLTKGERCRVNFIKLLFQDLKKNASLLKSLAFREFKSAYTGSALGSVWLFVEPFLYMGIMWFFFTKAIQFAPSGNIPYMPWLMTSMILWTFFNSCMNNLASVFKTYSYLMKQKNFNLSVLPFVTIFSAFLNHLIFLGFLISVFLISGVSFSLYWFQAIYYLFALTCLLIGIGWITASVSLFFKDIRNIINIILQIGFWTTPIFWDANSIPEKFQLLIKLNPLFYVFAGYRNSFLYHVGFWQDFGVEGIYFWSFTLLISVIGALTYKKLRPHFGDVI